MSRKRLLLSVSFMIMGLLLLLAACTQNQPEQSVASEDDNATSNTTTSHEEMATEDSHAETAHWEYTGANGPDHWGDLDPRYQDCRTGMAQSPIDITNVTTSDLADIVFNYKETAVTIHNNGHTIQVNYDNGSTIELNGTTYTLAQFHFHTPSEHILDGQPAAAEMHLVHKNAAGANAVVVGVMIQEGAENAAFAPVWENLPATSTKEAETIAGAFIDAADLLPVVRTYYTYQGSLTTPPCTEGITWLVLTTPIEMSAAQIAIFNNIIGNNNRPIQPRNERPLIEDTTSTN